jgi:precorrin-2 dehydrogenase/sirohydrochlorin ferrochelatase
MSGYPILLEGTRIQALIVGGGGVAERKAGALLECGAEVRVVSPEISPGLRALVAGKSRLSIIERAYQTGDIGTATLVIAATRSRAVNGRVAADARANGRLVIVADSSGHGNSTSMAAHRVGALVIGVSAAGVPSAAKRIRDAVAERFDGRYAAALDAMSALRRRLLESDDPDAWAAANLGLLGRDFCALVEGGDLTARVARWPVEQVSASEGAAWR